MITPPATTPPKMTKIHVGQGCYEVSSDPGVTMTTVLGSCVATCLHDRRMGAGGMNHLLLPPGQRTLSAESVGVHLMELLVNSLMKLGCSRRDLVAKLFGGANVLVQGSTVGARNIEFARGFLEAERIPCIAESVGGNAGRVIRFSPVSGHAAQMMLARTDHRVAELRDEPQPVPMSMPAHEEDEIWG